MQQDGLMQTSCLSKVRKTEKIPLEKRVSRVEFLLVKTLPGNRLSEAAEAKLCAMRRKGREGREEGKVVDR